MSDQAYIYVTRSEYFAGRWAVQVIHGRTVYTPDDNLTLDDRDAVVAENKSAFPDAIVSWDE